jgi:hypothetical protein
MKKFELNAAKFRDNPASIQLAVRVPCHLHALFYAACAQQGYTGSEVLRSLMHTFVQLTEEQTRHAN